MDGRWSYSCQIVVVMLYPHEALIRRTITDLPPNRPQTAMVCENFSRKADCIATSNRSPLATLHTPLLKAYTHLLDQAADPTCPLCMEEPQTVEQWLQRCPNLDVLMQRTFGSPSLPLGVLTTDTEVLKLARAPF